MDKDQLQSAKGHLTSFNSSGSAPRPVFEAMFSLTGTAEPHASIVEFKEGSNGSVWKALWLVEGALAYVEATKAADVMWDLASHDQQHDSLTAWIRPLSEVVRLEVRDVTLPDREFGTSWTWAVGEVVVFRDGTVLPVPMTRDYANSNEAKNAEAFMAALKDDLFGKRR